jgi:hypothetical protein
MSKKISQLKPVLVKILTGNTIEEIRVFDTLKLVYEAYAGDLTTKDFHCFRGAIFPKSNVLPNKKYNVINLKHIQEKLRIASCEWLTPEDAMSLLKNREAVDALEEKNFFELRGKYGHLIKTTKVESDEVPVVETPVEIKPVIDVVANKESFTKAYKALSKVFHGKHVGISTINSRFSLNNLPGFPMDTSEEIRELAFLSWASDKTPSPEQIALIGFVE